MDNKARRQHARSHVSPKLRRSLRLFLVISAVLFVAVIFAAVHYHAIIWQVLLALIAGVLVGTAFARMYKRENLVHFFTHNERMPAISLALLAGGMYGRTLGSVHVIGRMLPEQRVFSRHAAA